MVINQLFDFENHSMAEVSICRLCLNICKQYVSLYDENGLGTDVYMLTVKYFDSKILNMELEKHLTAVCLRCWNHMLNFNAFEQTVVVAQTKLNCYGKDTDKEHDVVVLSEDDSRDSNYQMNIEDELIYLHDTEAIDVHHKEFSFDYVTECGDFSSNDDNNQTSREFRDSIDTSMPEYVTEETCNNIDKDIEFISEGEELQTPVITGNISQDDCDIAKRLTEDSYDDIIAQWKPSLKCQICRALYSRFSLLRQHFEEKHPREKFSISCCQCKFTEEDNFAEHIRFHLNQIGLKCIICGNAYPTTRILTDHLLMQHSGIKVKSLLKCPKCPMRFNSELKYKRHMKEHDNSQHDHNCSKCGKMFSTGNRRILHERMAHGIHRLCKDCGRTFRNNQDFTQHQLQHENNSKDVHVCNVCGQLTKTALELHTHHSTHIKVDNYICSHCPKRFQHRSSLKNHEKNKHSGEVIHEDSQYGLRKRGEGK